MLRAEEARPVDALLNLTEAAINYYPFHLGDYAAHTSHLEPLEDLAYRRMLDLYYLREQPLPTSPADVARLVRMRQHLGEVEAVLNEFFVLTEDGWRHTRCDAELDRMQDKQATSESKAAHESERMRRHRERRAELFAALRERGQVPAWDTPMKELQRLHDSTRNAPETHLQREQAVSCVAPATAIPTPTPTPTPTPKEEEGDPRKRRSAPDRPDGVAEQVWSDWLQLRKAKKAPVTKTVVDGAAREAQKAGMALGDFLAVWCRRGSQGLEADWLRPEERGRPQASHESFRERDQRLAAERVREATGGLCHDRKATGDRPRELLPFERGYVAPSTTNTIEGEAHEPRRVTA